MVVLGGLAGAIVGFALGIVLSEILLPNNTSWSDVIPFGMAVLGWLVGTSTVRAMRERHRSAATPR